MVRIDLSALVPGSARASASPLGLGWPVLLLSRTVPGVDSSPPVILSITLKFLSLQSLKIILKSEQIVINLTFKNRQFISAEFLT